MNNYPVARIMTPARVTIGVDETVEAAARKMLDARIGSVLVVDEGGSLTGIVTQSDFATHEAGVPFSTFRAPQLMGRWIDRAGIDRLYREARRTPVREIMSTPVHTVGEDGTLWEILDLMCRFDIEQVPVLRDGRPVGIVAHHDLLKLVLDEVENGDGSAVEGAE